MDDFAAPSRSVPPADEKTDSGVAGGDMYLVGDVAGDVKGVPRSDGNPKDIKSLILKKESELQSLTNYRLESLQSLLNQKTSHLSQVTSQFNKLREDFEYNIKVVEGRDRELKRYEDYVLTLEQKINDAAEDGRRAEQVRQDDKDAYKKEVAQVKDEVQFWKGKFDAMVKEADDNRFKWERDRDQIAREVEEGRRESQRLMREREEVSKAGVFGRIGRCIVHTA